MPADAPATVRLLAAGAGVAPFAVPAAAWHAIETVIVANAQRPYSFAELPAGGEECTVLAVFLASVMNGDPNTEGGLSELLRGCPDWFMGGGVRQLVEWLHDAGGFRVEG